ncbi:MAG: polysaccharide biosynthesis/export family protein [Bacteroidaceae bacterium]|nr:polysaccharide biosynthesis/export family protein [Bacteroidaceae bacterium]
MKRTIRTITFLCFLLAIAACKTPSKFIYLEDMPIDKALPISFKQETHVKPGDRLAIHVNCSKQELAVPFNSISHRVDADGKTISSESTDVEGYLVDAKGFIDFPTLGPLEVGGLTLPQIKEYIQGLLIEGKHIPDGSVDVRMTNFTIYGMGALTPGKLVVPDAKINILQAVAQMGDLQGRAKYEKVRVIREEDGERMEFDIDMTSTNLFNSPAFYLQQNDIVYAEPKKRDNNASNKAAMWVSIVAVLTSIAYSITYIIK